MTQHENPTVDVLLVGAGIMSATLGVLLKELDAGLRIELVEQMEGGAAESSNPWNNAGTGHAGLCELNYTPEKADGSIDTQKAITINTQFEVSKQFWSHLVENGTFGSAQSFVSSVPHLSFVHGESGIVVYGELHAADVRVGDTVRPGQLIGRVVRVLKVDKGRPMDMLHLELRAASHPDALTLFDWAKDLPRPDWLLDPTPHLLAIPSAP